MAKQSKEFIIENRKARHDYTILEVFEAGIVLAGTEVKSLRNYKVQMQESYVQIIGDELFVFGLWIDLYDHGNIHNHKENRKRKLLMHKNEILKLKRKSQDNLTIIPLKIYLKKRHFKVSIALAKGKKLYDKRQLEKKRDAQKAIDRALKS